MTAVGSKFPLSRVNLQVAMGLFYPTACQASYFFHHYQEGGKYVYRDKWWEYLKLDYTGELELPSYFNTTKSVDAFKRVFNIKSDADWDALDKKFVDYILQLTPEDVGKGIELPTEEPPSEENRSINPEARQLPEGAQQSANRREEEALAA
jgi:hypothetical protein